MSAPAGAHAKGGRGQLLLTCEEAPLVIVDPGMLPLLGGRTSLLKALEQVTDPRARRGVRHNIASTLAIVVAAGLSWAGPQLPLGG